MCLPCISPMLSQRVCRERLNVWWCDVGSPVPSSSGVQPRLVRRKVPTCFDIPFQALTLHIQLYDPNQSPANMKVVMLEVATEMSKKWNRYGGSRPWNCKRSLFWLKMNGVHHHHHHHHHLQSAARAWFVHKWMLCDKNIPLGLRLKFFNAVITPVACFAAGHRTLYPRDVRRYDIEMLRRMIRPPAGIDWSAPWQCDSALVARTHRHCGTSVCIFAMVSGGHN